MRYQRKPSTVEAAQVGQDLTLADGTVVPAGHWLCIHEDGHTTAVNDVDFAAEYEPVPEPAPAEPVTVEAAASVEGVAGPEAPQQ